MKLMSLVILGNTCQDFTSFSPLFTQRRRDRDGVRKSQKQKQDREEHIEKRYNRAKFEKDSAECE